MPNSEISVQYRVTNKALFDEIFLHFPKFVERLNKGPEEIKQYLFELWNREREFLKNNMHLKARDIDKEVSISDFNATAYKTKNGTSVFFFTFPDCDFIDGSSKYVAFAWAPQRPMYFTLEYSEHALDNHKPCWVFGEFFVKDSRQQHNNYGTIDDIGLKEFVSLVLEKLDSQNI